MHGKSVRQEEIRQHISESGHATVAELCALLNVSEATVRRDLDDLAASGVIVRHRGGAARQAAPVAELPIYQRARELAEAKDQIGRAAASLVLDGEAVFLGSGSTVFAVAQHLKQRSNLTIITNSLPVVNLLANAPDLSVIVLGGLLRQSELSMIGHLTEQAIGELRPDKVIMGMRAIDVDRGLTSDYLSETMTDRCIVNASPKAIIVADHTKFARTAPAFVAPITVVDTIVTDAGIAPEIAQSLVRAGIRVLTAGALVSVLSDHRRQWAVSP